MVKEGFFAKLWDALISDREAVCALSLGNLGALVLLMVLEIWASWGGR